jgi:hypothetical protein
MKKSILIFLMIFGAYQLKAQQLLLPVKPLDSLSNKIDDYFKIKPNVGLQFLQPQVNLNQPIKGIPDFFNNKFNSHMPVIVLDGYDSMPIAKLEGYSKMPIERIDVVAAPLITPKPIQ